MKQLTMCPDNMLEALNEAIEQARQCKALELVDKLEATKARLLAAM